MLTLHCWFEQQSRVSLNRENITKTHAIVKHTLLDGEFAINICHLWWRSSQLATMYDDVTVTKWLLISKGYVFTPSACHSVSRDKG